MCGRGWGCCLCDSDTLRHGLHDNITIVFQRCPCAETVDTWRLCVLLSGISVWEIMVVDALGCAMAGN